MLTRACLQRTIVLLFFLFHILSYSSPSYAESWNSYVTNTSTLAFTLIRVGTVIAIAWSAIKAIGSDSEQAKKHFSQMIILIFTLVAIMLMPTIIQTAQSIAGPLSWNPGSLR